MATRQRSSRTNLGTIARLGLPLLAAVLLLPACQSSAGAHAPDSDAVGSESDEAAGSVPEVESESSAAARPVDPRVTAAVHAYEAYLRGQAAALPAQVRPFTDAVRAGDLATAKRTFATSRLGWERIQSIAMLLPDFDRQLDAESEDFTSPTDPRWTGWHRLEHMLWSPGGTAGAARFADQLDRDLARLDRAVAALPLTPKIMADSIERLAEEALAAKLPGAEDRYARTDLADLAGNVEGAQAGYRLARSALVAHDPELAGELDRRFAAVDHRLARYRTPTGYRPYPALSATDRLALRAELTTLAESLAQLAGALRR